MKNKLGLSWAKLKFSWVGVVDEVKLKLMLELTTSQGGGWLWRWWGLGFGWVKINAKQALTKV